MKNFLSSLLLSLTLISPRAFAADDDFGAMLAKAAQMSTLTTPGSRPFHLKLEASETRKGDPQYEAEIEVWWAAPDKWRREIQLGNLTVAESRSENKLFRRFPEASLTSGQIDGFFRGFLDLMDLPFPDRKYAIYEADWGQSAVQLDGVDTIRVARGQVDSNNQPITGQAFWFDSAGLLRAAYEQPRTTAYSDFAVWNEKQVPRRIEVTQNGARIIFFAIDRIDSPDDLTDSFFELEGATPEITGDPQEKAGAKP